MISAAGPYGGADDFVIIYLKKILSALKKGLIKKRNGGLSQSRNVRPERRRREVVRRRHDVESIGHPLPIGTHFRQASRP